MKRLFDLDDKDSGVSFVDEAAFFAQKDESVEPVKEEPKEPEPLDLKLPIAPSLPSNVILFGVSMKHCKVGLEIDGTLLGPSPKTMLSFKNFEKRYLEQLEAYIYNHEDNLREDALLELLHLFRFIDMKQYPIALISGRHRHKLPTIAKVLDQFVRKNYQVLSGIYTSFNSLMHSNQG